MNDAPSTPRRSTAGLPADGGIPSDVTAYQRSVALTWVRRGVPVIPCSRTEKRPLVGGFAADATDEQLAKFYDPAQVDTWWSGRYKRAHVGILTRALVVIDLDMPKLGTPPLSGRWDGCQGGTDVFEQYLRSAGADWPTTYTVVTPSGGVHLYFRQPEGAPIGCATGDGPTAPHLGPLVDVRGVGGLVIAAGSYSAARARPYMRVSAPDVEPQPLPDWLLSLLRPPATQARPAQPVQPLPVTGSRAERYATAALNGAAEDVAQAVEGERNRRLFAAARKLGELHPIAPTVLDETTVREQLLTAALAAGLRDRASLASIESGWSKGLANPTVPKTLLGGAA